MLVLLSFFLIFITFLRFIITLQKKKDAKYLWVSLYIQLICLGGCYTFFRPLNDVLRSGPFIQNFTIEISSLVIIPLLLFHKNLHLKEKKNIKPYIIITFIFLTSLINPLNHSTMSTLAFMFNLFQNLLVFKVIRNKCSNSDIYTGIVDGLKICIFMQSLLVLAYPILHMNSVLTLFKGENGLTWVDRRENYSSALGTFGHPATLALFSLLAGIIFEVKYLLLKNRQDLYFIFLSIFCIYFTYSRTSFVATFFTFFIIYISYKIKMEKLSIRFIITFVLVIISLVIILYFSPLSNLFFKSNADEMFEARMLQFALVPQFLKESFWFGVGINSHVYYMSYYLHESWFLNNFFISNPIHNAHLIVLVETGVVGFLIWVAYFIYKERIFYRNKYVADYSFFFDLVFANVLIAITIYSTFGWTACSKEILTLVIFLGYISFNKINNRL